MEKRIVLGERQRNFPVTKTQNRENKAKIKFQNKCKQKIKPMIFQ